MTSTAISKKASARRNRIGQLLYDIGFWLEYTIVRLRRCCGAAVRYIGASLEGLLLLVLRPLALGLVYLRQVVTSPQRLLRLAVTVALAVGLGFFVRSVLALPFVLEVTVGGKSVGYVASEQDFDTARADVLARVRAAQALLEAAGKPAPDWDLDPAYTLTVAPVGTAPMNESEIANAILQTSGGEITEATAVYVDDELRYVTTEGDHLRSYLESLKAPLRTLDGGIAGFVHDLRLVDGVYLTASVTDYARVLTALQGEDGLLQTKLTRYDTYTQPVAYETQLVPDDTMAFGVQEVVQQGVEGYQYVTYETTIINGETTDMQIINITPKEAAVPEIVHEGTKLSNGMVGKLGTGTFIWPVPNYRSISRWATLTRGSSYHRGTDIAAPEGTPIYAADSGTVITAEYHHHYLSWGNYVMIDHGNGYKTLYAHMTQYVVNAGDTVEQGQLIGYVGNTGYSLGNHCHFEMYYNNVLFNAKEVFPDMPIINPDFVRQ